MSESDKKVVDGSELANAKLEAMRIRFRRVLGESVSPHTVRNARRNIAKCVRSLRNNEVKNA
jgi:ribosomal protein L29